MSISGIVFLKKLHFNFIPKSIDFTTDSRLYACDTMRVLEKVKMHDSTNNLENKVSF